MNTRDSDFVAMASELPVSPAFPVSNLVYLDLGKTGSSNAGSKNHGNGDALRRPACSVGSGGFLQVQADWILLTAIEPYHHSGHVRGIYGMKAHIIT